VKALDYWANEKSKITSKVTANLTYMDPDEMFRAMAHIPRMNLQGLGDPVPGADEKNGPYSLSGEVKFFGRFHSPISAMVSPPRDSIYS